MKNKYIIWLLVTAIFVAGSCKKWIDTGINTDPSNPSDVTIDLLLPSAEADLAYNLGGDMVRPASIWTQQLAGISNQSQDEEHYIYSESDADNMWKFGIYTNTLINLKTMMSKAKVLNSPYYVGVGQILTAYTLGITTDLFGDIPYSQALQGNANLKPKYDTQQQIYQSITNLLDSGIINLNAASSVFAPSSSSELIYGGNNAEWIATANSLLARYALHLSKVNGSQAYKDALTALSKGAISSNSGDLDFAFGQNASNNSPVYQFDQQRPQYIALGALLVDSLINANDPRLTFFADTAYVQDTLFAVGNLHRNYYGSKPGELNLNASPIGDAFKAPDSKVTMISFVEKKFIEAEANFQLGNLVVAATAYNTAVIASLVKNGVKDTIWQKTHVMKNGSFHYNE